jgi:TP901 family phage tail tape measure protein
MANPIKSSDIFLNDGSVKQFTDELERLIGIVNKLKGESVKLEVELKKANIATAAGKETVKKTGQQYNKLEKELEKYNAAIDDHNIKIQAAREATRKANQLSKLTAKLKAAEKGSYDALSAQYSINKMRLNQMSAAQRKATKEGQQLEKQSKKLYSEMKRLQEATGKHQLSVGDYGKSIRGVVKNLMGSVGLIGGVALLGRTLVDSARSVIKFEKTQSKLASVLAKSKEDIRDLTEDAKLYGLTTAFTATQVTELQVALAKLGFTQDEISLSTKSLINFATALDVEVGDAAKVGGAALRAFNLDASQMDRVVSTLAVSTTKSAAEFEDFETLISTAGPVANSFGFQIEDLTALFGKLKDSGFEANKAATATRNILLNLADANGNLAKELGGNVKNFDELVDGLNTLNQRGVSLNKTLELTDKRSVAAFNVFLSSAEASRELRDGLIDVNDELQTMVDTQLDNLAGDITLLQSAWDGFIKSIEEGSGPLARASRDITNFATNLLIRLSNIDIELTRQQNLTSDQLQRWFEYLNIVGDQEGKKFQYVIDSFNRQDFKTVANSLEEFKMSMASLGNIDPATADEFFRIYIKKRADQEQLKINADRDRDKAEAERKEKEAAAQLEQDKSNAEKRRKLAAKQAKEKERAEREAARLRIESMEDGEEKEQAFLKFTFDQKLKEWEKYGLDTVQLTEWFNRRSGEITEKYQKIELDRAKKVRDNAASFNESRLKNAISVIDQDAELAKLQIDNLEDTEAEKTRLTLEAEKDRLQKILKLKEASGSLINDKELEILRAQIAAVNKEINGLGKEKPDDIYSILGFKLDDPEKQALNDSFSFAKQQLDEYVQKRVEVAAQNVELSNNEVSSAENALQREIDNRNAGYAHNTQTAEKELKDAKRRQAQAIAEQRKAQREQQAIQTAEQTSSLITATANLWASYSKAGLISLPVALGSIATMWGSFLYSKIKAAQLTKTQYGEGGYDILDGGSHASGNDTFMYASGGKNVFGERGEMVATINRRNTNKYRPILPTIIDSLNKGTFEHVFTAANRKAQAIQINTTGGTETAKMEKILAEIRDKKQVERFVDGKGRLIEIQGNTKRIYID